jgi:hypothetical protein
MDHHVPVAMIIVRSAMASLAFLASATITVVTLRAENGLKSPYRRIIFGLSISDILQSVSLLVGPFAVPRDHDHYHEIPWAKGTVGTCEAAGFFLTVGATTIPFYTLFLSYYFLKRVKDKMTPEQFSRRYELKIHAFIWIFNIIGGIVGLASKHFNPARDGDFCVMEEFPHGCSADPDVYGACVRGKNTTIDTLVIVLVPFLLTFFTLIINLLRLTVYVYYEERNMRLSRGGPDEGDNVGSCWNKLKASIFCRTNCNRREIDSRGQSTYPRRQRSLAMQTLGQSSLYILAYFITYFSVVVGVILAALGTGAHPLWNQWIGAIFWPLGGFFNIVIYTLPKVSKFKRLNPAYSNFPWIVIFIAVLFSGGEVPEVDYDEDSGVRVGRRDGKDESYVIDVQPVGSILRVEGSNEEVNGSTQKEGTEETNNDAAKPMPQQYSTPFITAVTKSDTSRPKYMPFFVTTVPTGEQEDGEDGPAARDDEVKRAHDGTEETNNAAANPMPQQYSTPVVTVVTESDTARPKYMPFFVTTVPKGEQEDSDDG